MRTHLYITFGTGQVVDLGPAARPHNSIGTARNLLEAARGTITHVAWQDPDGGLPAFEAELVSRTSMAWRVPSMAAPAFMPVALMPSADLIPTAH